MKRTILTFSFALFILASCSKSSDPKFGPDINGNRVACSSGQKFSVDLDVHSKDGYQWSSDISDTSVVILERADYASKSDQQTSGGLAVATLYFRAIKSGQGKINLNERRGGEKDSLPINTIQFSVAVK